MNLALPAPAASGSLGANESLVIDTGPHTCTWTGSSSTTWATASNWSGCANVAPQPIDSVVIPNTTRDPVAVTTAVAAVTVQSGGVITATSGSFTLTVTGDFTNAGTFSPAVGTVVVGGNFTNSGTFSPSGGNLTLAGNFTNNGTMASTVTSTFTFNGSSDQTIGGSTASGNNFDFRRLVVNTTNGAAVTLTSAIQVNSASTTNGGNLTVTTGTFDDGGFVVTGQNNGSGLALSVASGATLRLGGTTTMPPGFSSYSLNSASTTEYYGANQAVSNAATYGTLKISGTGTKTAAGTLAIIGDLNVAASTLDLATYTANRSSAGGTLSLAAGTTLRIGGTQTFPTNYSTRTLAPTSTVEYYGTNQSVANQAYGNLTLSTSGTKTLASGTLNIAGNLTINGTASITAVAAINVGGNVTLNGGTFNAGSSAHTVAGDFTKAGGATFTASTGTFTFNGSAPQTISGGPTFNNLTIDGAGVTLSGANLTVGGVLTLTTGIVSTGANAVVSTFTAAGGVTGASAASFVAGTLTRTISTGAQTRTFDVGTGSDYAPATVAFASVTSQGTLSVSSTAAEHASIATSDLDPTKDANRFWTMTPGGGLAFTTYDATLTYVAGDLDGAANPGIFAVRKFSAGTWTAPPGGSSATSTSATGLGFTGFSDFVVGQVANRTPAASAVVDTPNEDQTKTVTLTGIDPDGDNTTFTIIDGPLHGTIGAIGSPDCGTGAPRTCTATIDYTPDPDFNGPDSFTYSVNDGEFDSPAATVALTVNAVNDAPSFVKGADESISEDTGAQTVSGWATLISSGPADEIGQSVHFEVVANDNTALFAAGPEIAADGTLTYTTAPDGFGLATVTVVAVDDGGVVNGGVDTSDPQTFQITVAPVNDAPVSANDSYQVLEDHTLTIDAPGVLLDDTDVDNLATELSAVVDTSTTHGSLTLNADGSFTYTPAADYNGSDSFTYHVNDGALDSEVATVTIAVTAVNDAPSFTAGDDVVVAEDAGAQSLDAWATSISAGPADEAAQTVDFEVLANDNTALFATQPEIAADGTLSFETAPDANGFTTVTVAAVDSGGTDNGGVDTSDEQTFQITVTPVNDAPVATDDHATALEDTPLTVDAPGVLGNDSDVDNSLGQLSAAVVDEPTNGSVALNPDGSYTYTPAADFNGSDSFTYRVNDASLDSNLATVVVDVTAVNDAPSFAAGADQTVLEDTGAQSVPAWASAISPGPADESGQNVDFLVTNDDNALFSAQPAVGADGTLTYTAAPDAYGSATVTVAAVDDGGTANGGSDTSADQTFTITVTPVNDVPSFTAGSDQTTTEDAGAQTVPGWATLISSGPANESSQVLTFDVTNDANELFASQPAVGADGTLTYEPAPNANGSATVSVTLHDDGGIANGGIDTSPTQTFTIAVTAVNDPPVALSDNYTTLEDHALAVDAPGVLANDSDVDNAPGELSAAVVDEPTNGSVALGADGSFLYTPDADFNGTDTFTYRTSDGQADSDLATVDVVVTPVNDAPSFTGGSDESVLEDTGAQTVAGWATDMLTGPANESDQTATFAVTTDNPALFSVAPAIAADGTLTYTAAPDANGSATATVTLQDDGGIVDGGQDTSSAYQFLITVTAVNDIPSFAAGADQTVLEDAGAQTVNGWAADVSAGPSDENAQALSFEVSNDANGLFATQPAIAADGTLTYEPAPDANGSATVTVTLHDDGGTDNGGVDTSAAQTFGITVTAVNDAPSFTDAGDVGTAEDASAQTIPSWATTLSAGPADESAQALSFELSSDNPSLFSDGPAVAPDGTLTYTPAANANGSTTVTVTLHDDGGTDNGGVDTSVVHQFVVTVDPVNDAPVAVDDSTTTLEDTPVTVDAPGVLGNDTDIDNSAAQLTAVLGDAPQHGSVTLNADGSYTYTPDADYNGADSFTYQTFDGVDLSAQPATVVISVSPVNDVPSFTAGADQTVLEDAGTQTVNGWAAGISAGPADESGQALTFTVTNTDNALFTSQPAVGADGTLTFESAPDANGSATVTVSLADDGGTDSGGVDTSAVQQFTITVTPVNDGPSFTSGGDVTVAEDAGPQSASWATAISAGPFDESGQALTFAVGNDNTGLFSSQPTIAPDGTLSFESAPNANGSATVTVSVSDDGGTDNGGVDTSAEQTFTITVTAVDDAPVAVDDAATTLEDTPVTVDAPGVLGNDTDLDNAANELTAVVATAPAHGSVTLNADGSYTYTPDADSNGADSFTYQTSDGTNLSNVATVNIDVTPVNDVPVFTAGGDVTVAEDAAPQSDLWATAISAGPADEAGQALAFSVGNDNNDLFTQQPAIAPDGSLTFESAPDANGSATVTVSLADDGGTDNGGVDTSAEATFVVHVTAVNDAPAAANDAYTTAEDTALTVDALNGVLANDTDIDSPVITASIVTSPAHGTLTLGGDGSFGYTPDGDYNGTDSFTYVANDGFLNSNLATVTITDVAVNDVPVFTAGTDQTVLEDAGAQTVPGWATAISAGPADEAGQALTFSVTNDSNGLFTSQPTVGADGTLTFESAPDANGSATVTVALSDDGGTDNGGVDTSAEQTFTITVTPVNDAPAFTSGGDVTVAEDAGPQSESWATALSAGPADEALQALTFSVGNDNHTLFTTQPTVGADGTLTFESAPDANGSATVTVALSDDGGTDNAGADRARSRASRSR